MRFIDSHCHLHHRKFNKDRNQLLEQIGESEISAFIEVPIGLRSNSDMRKKIALPQVYFAAGTSFKGGRTGDSGGMGAGAEVCGDGKYGGCGRNGAG